MKPITRLALVAIALGLAACAYRPIVDPKRSDMARYETDLAECRQIAEQAPGPGTGAAVGAAVGYGGAHRGPRSGARGLLGDLPAFGEVGFVARHVAALGIDDGAVGAGCEAERDCHEGETGYRFHLMLPCKTTRA